MAVVIDKSTHTRELVSASGLFALSIPCRALADLTTTVGHSTGRDIAAPEDKFSRYRIGAFDGPVLGRSRRDRKRQCLAPSPAGRERGQSSGAGMDNRHMDKPEEKHRARRLMHVTDTQLQQLTALLIDCVDGGASVSFMHPLTAERAAAFWQRVAAGVAAGERALLVAEDEHGSIVGTVQLVFDLPENQPHRADLAKMLVHRRARRQGIAERLMRAAEDAAREAGKTLLVLDTVTGGDAERLYARLGWQRVGSIPEYALFPRGGYCATTYFYRHV